MNIKNSLENLLVTSFNKNGFDTSYAVVVSSSRPEICEYQCNAAFALSKIMGQNPQEIAKKIIQALPLHEFVAEVSFVPPAFINFKLKNNFLSDFANELFEDPNFGITKNDKPEKVLLDYGGANVAKELHVGHLRSPIIGESIKRLYKFFGNIVVADTHLGDWGLQMGLTIAQLQEDGALDYYFVGKGKKPEITLNMLNEAYPKASKRKNTEPDFKNKADDYTLKIQHKQEPFYTIFKQIREASIKAIEKNYAALNSYYDLWYGESTAAPYIDRTVKMFVDSGLARKSEGALVVDVARENEHVPIPKKSPDEPQLYKNPMPPAVIKKFNDGDLYTTTDIATVLMRNESDHYDKMIYITDNRQGLHFEQVFRCAKLVGISPESQELIFIGFGTMKGSDGKPFKTRSGDTIKLEDIINMLKTKANEKMVQNGLEKDDSLALKIGVGAMKYGDLSNECTKDYVFELDKFASFEGKTGPYIQYTAVRIKSLLAKTGKFVQHINIETEEEKNIIIALTKLIDSYLLAYKGLNLAPICVAVYNLASSFSTLYNNIRILSEKNKERRDSLLSLSKLVYKNIKNALDILAIDIPEKM